MIPHPLICAHTHARTHTRFWYIVLKRSVFRYLELTSFEVINVYDRAKWSERNYSMLDQVHYYIDYSSVTCHLWPNFLLYIVEQSTYFLLTVCQRGRLENGRKTRGTRTQQTRRVWAINWKEFDWGVSLLLMTESLCRISRKVNKSSEGNSRKTGLKIFEKTEYTTNIKNASTQLKIDGTIKKVKRFKYLERNSK